MRGIKISLFNMRTWQFFLFVYIHVALWIPKIHKLSCFIVNGFFIGKKERKLFSSDYLDFIYAKSLSLFLDKHLEPLYSESLYSFRKGRSSFQLLNDLRQRMREFDGEEFFVLKADISSYGENIRHDHLERLLPPLLWRHVKKLVQNECFDGKSHRSFCNIIGLPTGSPIVPPLENLYLLQFDQAMLSLSPIFYGRFGDDFIVVTSDLHHLNQFQKNILEHLSQLGLSIHPDKVLTLKFRLAPDSQDCFEHLGISFQGNGYFALPQAKFKSLCEVLKREIRRLGHLCRHLEIPLSHRMKIICESLTRELSSYELGNVNWQYWMQIIDDPVQLKSLDQYQRQQLLKVVFGKISGKGFRKVDKAFFHKSHYSFQHVANLFGENP